MRTIKRDHRGKHIVIIQLMLNRLLKKLNPKLKPDGHFGHLTERAVKSFQKEKKLKSDGEVGPKTMAALELNAGSEFKKETPTTGKSWLDIAEGEFGVSANTVAGKDNARIIEYHSTTTLKATNDETPWCSSFVNWVVIQSGKKGTNSAAAASWKTWGTEVKKPKKGCIILIKKKVANATGTTGTGNHVGFYISESPGFVYIIGGNQNDRVGHWNVDTSKWEVLSYRE